RWPAVALGASATLLLLPLVALIGSRAAPSFGVRGVVWSAAVRIGLRHVTGVGLGQAGAVIAARTPSGAPILHAHNLWLNWLVETGPLGLLSVTALTLTGLLTAWQGSRAGSRMAVGALAGLASFLLMSVFDDPANLGRIALTFWVALAVSAADAPPT